MKIKIFCGPPQTVEEEIATWLQQNRQRIGHVLQSQSTDGAGNMVLTVSLFYEEGSTGTGLGFRRQDS